MKFYVFFSVIFDTCDVVYNLFISLLPLIVLDNLFGVHYRSRLLWKVSSILRTELTSDPLVKIKFNLKSARVNLAAPASPIECLLYLPNVRAIQYKLGPERLTRIGNSNALRLPVRKALAFDFTSLTNLNLALDIFNILALIFSFSV